MKARRRLKKDETWMYVIDPAKIRRRRRDKGLSQVELAALARCTQQYISLIEQGATGTCPSGSPSASASTSTSSWRTTSRSAALSATPKLQLPRESVARRWPDVASPLRLMNAFEAAEELGLSEYQVRAEYRRGILPGRKAGRLVRFTATDLQVYVDRIAARTHPAGGLTPGSRNRRRA